MKRIDLEGYLGQNVDITLFDGMVISGELHKTGEERLKNNPNLYLPRNSYFLIRPQSDFLEVSCIFKCSHVKKLKKRA